MVKPFKVRSRERRRVIRDIHDRLRDYGAVVNELRAVVVPLIILIIEVGLLVHAASAIMH